MERRQSAYIQKDLAKKMVLLVGPRQAGKTWLSKKISESYDKSIYLNYDQVKDRVIIQNQSWIPETELIIFDELHKMPSWKNYLKGVFDTKRDSQKILVTGSARLNVYDQLGDSLAGRYFRHRLLPFSLAELKEEKISLSLFLERGGFPEPLFSQDLVDADRWRLQYINSLLSTDIFEIDIIHNLKGMNQVLNILRSRVGSPASYSSISRDVGLSPTTVKKYIQILEAVYIIFTIQPYTERIHRSILKEPKIYFFDTGLVNGDKGARLENFVAVSLLKSLYAREDVLAESLKLHYLRTKEGIEVDFAVAKNNQIEKIIEVKTSDSSIGKSLRYYHDKYDFPAIQLVMNLRNEFVESGISCLKAENYLSNLFI